MTALARHRLSEAVTAYGNGSLGGKGEGLLFADEVRARRLRGKGAEPLVTSMLTTSIYRRYRDNGGKFDAESLAALREIHAPFDKPLSVRSSEEGENDPGVPTSGNNPSFMLPNNNPGLEARFSQFLQAVRHVFEQFTWKMVARDADDEVAVAISPIHGVHDKTRAGHIYYPMSAGVADSVLYYPVAGIGMDEGVARVVFGHGYGAVRADSDINAIPVLSVRKPSDTSGIRAGQTLFYALGMESNETLSGDPMETMKKLNVSFAGSHAVHFGSSPRGLNFGGLIGRDDFGYASGLRSITEALAAESSSPFQIEFIFNIVNGKGAFHIVQYKKMRDIASEPVEIPEGGKDVLLSTDRVQGHGVVPGLRHAIVISPFTYSKEKHNEATSALRELNERMKAKGEKYVLVCPGRVGTNNPDWGINVEFQDISQAAVVVEYGYDISGSPYIPSTRQEMTGGIYGSHFLYQMLGGAAEDARIRELRMRGSQGTHFITNLITAGTIYLHIDPTSNKLDAKWFFSPPEGQENAPIYLKRFDSPVACYADLAKRVCVIK